jgi:hypothetical protein
MKQRLLVAFLTIVLLGAGYVAGVWTERDSCAVPPPPAPLLGELSKANPAPAATSKPHSPDAAKLAAEIERLRPKIDAFRTRLEQIDQELNQGIDALLTPAQRQHYAELRERHAKRRAKDTATDPDDPTPLTADEITSLQQRPLYKMLGIVVVPMRLNWMTDTFKLDAAQVEKLRQLLTARREKFLALVDESPPPSLQLSRLAPVAQRLGEPKP